MKIKLLLLSILALTFFTCKKKDKRSQSEKDEEIITKYISDNGLNATYSGSGLYYVIKTQGTGVNPNPNSTVTVKYDGLLVDGTFFDSSPSTGATFSLANVIKGWQEGLTYFKKGGKGTLLIPSALGYGSQKTGNIPPNSVLIFNIELLDVK
ncbi:MAG: FKBP-type peptidyl-prolyl cis-trans isomerase [Bacteroidota bacterium]|nr:FKBP-type peptidyl-prolyl cis-trans isomerase [Bacteroidota bacterium]